MERLAPTTSATSILIHVIEYFSDGYIILNGRKDILLVNDALLRMTGDRISFYLENSDRIIACFPLSGEPYLECPVVLPAADNRRFLFTCMWFHFSQDGRSYYIIKLTPVFSLPHDGAAVRSLPYELEEPALSYDRSGSVLDANDRFIALLGCTRNALPRSYMALHDREGRFSEKLERLGDKDKLHDTETILISPAGKRLVVLETVVVMREAGGRITGYVSTFRDITRFKSIEEQLAVSQLNYRRLFEIVTSPVIMLDDAGRVINMNASAEQLYRVRREEMIGVSYDEYFKVGAKSLRFERLLARAREKTGKFAQIGTPRRRSDGALIYTYATYTVVERDDKNPFTMFIMEKDLTARVRLEKRLEDMLRKVRETQVAAILGFARLTEYRDHTTGNHLRRIMLYTELLARELKTLPKYRDYIRGDYLESLTLSAVLHDIGKVGIEDSILLKPGKLTFDEYERMKQHTSMGGEALKSIDSELSYESFLTIGKEVAWYHHERWDGTGYPEGRKGEEIPLSARIVALADVYDALTSKRVYKPAYSHEEATAYIRAERGKHFDPDVADVFLTYEDEFRKIRESLSDDGDTGESLHAILDHATGGTLKMRGEYFRLKPGLQDRPAGPKT